jgi:hypothetical protein
MTISTCLRTAKLSVASIRPMQLRLARLGCGRSHSGTTRIERQRTAMLQPERLRWRRLPRAGDGNGPLPLARPLARRRSAPLRAHQETCEVDCERAESTERCKPAIQRSGVPSESRLRVLTCAPSQYSWPVDSLIPKRVNPSCEMARTPFGQSSGCSFVLVGAQARFGKHPDQQ